MSPISTPPNKNQSHIRHWLNLLYIGMSVLIGIGLVAMCAITIFGIQRAQAASQPKILLPQAPPDITIDDVSRVESDSGTTIYTFTVTLSNSSIPTVTVDYATADGIAMVSDNDYISASGTLTFTNSEITRTLSVLVNGDIKYEPDENFVINLSNPTNATILDGAGLGTIDNNDTLPGISITGLTQAEGLSGTSLFSFTISLTNPSYHAIAVDYSTLDGSATTLDGDYSGITSTLSFTENETSKFVGLAILGDSKYEIDEKFTVNLSNVISATIINGQAVGTILNDDVEPQIAIGDISQPEGNSGPTIFTYTVYLSNASYQTVGIGYSSADGTATLAGSDYLSASGHVGFLENQVTKPITVTVNGDGAQEPDETFFINLSTPVNASLVVSQAVGTILNDDAVPDISISDATVLEGNSGTTSTVFTVTLSQPSFQSIQVDFATNDGSAATLDNDYTGGSGTLVFDPGATSLPVTITVKGDTKFELDETFSVNLSGAVNASILDGAGLGTITNDDLQPTISINNVVQNEGNSGNSAFTFTVNLSSASYQTISADYATADGSATFANNDYGTATGSVIFSENQITKTVVVNVIGDTILEPDENYLVNLTNPSNAVISAPQGVGTIVNDEAQPAISINNASIIEGNSGSKVSVFSVVLSIPSYQAVTVGYLTADDIATIQDYDYISASGMLTFTIGQTTQLITITVNGDTKYELDETYAVNLSNPVHGTLADGLGVGTIVNDDPIPPAPGSPFGVEMNPIGPTGGLGWITPTLTSWTKGVEIAWSDVEPSPGARNWNVLAGSVAELKNAADNNLASIVVVGGAPEWAQKYQSPSHVFKTCGPVDSTYYDEFASFVVDLVKYLGSQNLHVQYWEFWNEPESPYIYAPVISSNAVDGCWGEPTDLNYGGNAYGQMLKTVYSAVTPIDPGTQILAGSLALFCDPNNPPAGLTCQSANFINGVLEEESTNGPLFHGISFQAYDTFSAAEGRYQNTNWNSSWNTTGPSTIAKGQYLNLRLQFYGINGKYLLNTRNTLVDPSCTQAVPYNCPKPTLYMEETKAYYVAQSYASAIADGLAANVWFDATGTWRRNNGLLTLGAPIDPLYAYQAYDFAGQILNGAQLVEKVVRYPAIGGYEFGFTGSNHHIWVIWSKSSTAQLVYLPAQPYAVYDVDGTPLPATQNQTVTTMPIYLDMPASVPRLVLPIISNRFTQVVVQNGDFELGAQGWTLIEQTLPATLVSSAPPSQPDPTIPLGTKSVLLGDASLTNTVSCNNVPANSYAAVEQTITVPAVPSQQSIFLEFKYIIYSQDYGASTSFDAFEIIINGGSVPVFLDGNLVQQGANPCAWNRVPSPGNPRQGVTSGWATGSINLKPYAGQTITVRFRNINRPDTFYNTYTFLDDVKVTLP